jgi:hypothetical protein
MIYYLTFFYFFMLKIWQKINSEINDNNSKSQITQEKIWF